MEAFIEFFNFVTGISIGGLQVVLILSVLLLLISPKKLQHPWFLFLAKYAVPIGFFLSLGAVVGSMVYSDIIGFVPCNLCWLQRIFIYPQVFLFGLAWYKKDSNIVDYSILLSAIGAFIAIYHKSVELTGNSLIPCSAAASCSKIYVEIFGYITIPVMSLTTLLFLLGLMVVKKYSKI